MNFVAPRHIVIIESIRAHLCSTFQEDLSVTFPVGHLFSSHRQIVVFLTFHITSFKRGPKTKDYKFQQVEKFEASGDSFPKPCISM